MSKLPEGIPTLVSLGLSGSIFFVISTAFMAGSVAVPECLLLCPQNATMQERLVPLQPIDLGAN